MKKIITKEGEVSDDKENQSGERTLKIVLCLNGI